MDQTSLKKYLTLIILFTSCALSLCAQSQDRSDEKRFLKWMVQDPLHITKNAVSNHFSELIFTSVGLASLSAYDHSASIHFQREFSFSFYLNAADEFGNLNYTMPLTAALFGASLFTSNSRFQDAAFTSFQSVLYTQLSVGAAKYMFARERPYQEEHPFDFEFFEGGATSFPSGHTSIAFAAVVPWAVYYPGPVTYGLLAIPLSTGIARVAKGRHWLTDVGAGAIIGAYWGYQLSKRHLNIMKNKDIDISPFVLQEGGGISLNVSF